MALKPVSLLIVAAIFTLLGCRVSNEQTPDFELKKKHVHFEGKDGKLEPNAWFLIAANQLDQALPCDDEAQCKRAMSQLPGSVCMQGKDLSRYPGN